MSDFLQMDIFFVTATIALGVVTILLSIVLVYALRIMRKIDHVSSLVLEEGELLKEDVDLLRADIRKKGLRISRIVDFLTSPKARARARRITK